MKIETNAQAVQALDTIICDCGISESEVITALENYLPTDDLIDFVKYLEKEFDLDLEQY